MTDLPNDAIAGPLEGDCLVCCACHGVPAKPVIAHFNTGLDSSKHYWGEVVIPCGVCNGTGKISVEVAKRFHAGQHHMKDRIERGETLFDAAKRLGIKPSQLSAYEHGKADLPAAQ